MEHYKILSEVPVKWKDLQHLTAKVLRGCGFEVEIEKTVETVRGKVEVDVYAEKALSYQTKIVCECKFWEHSIPQTIVHAFRAVMSDFGATYGFLISKKGFQKGAYDAIYKSNVALYTWDEFLDKFKVEWLHKIIERNYKLGRELMHTGHEIIRLMHNGELNVEINMDDFYAKKESDAIFFTFKEHYLDLPSHEISIAEIDTRINQYKRRLPCKISSYSDYFNCIYNECNEILDSWKEILSKKK